MKIRWMPDRIADDPTYDHEYVWPYQRQTKYTSGHYDEEALEERGLEAESDVEEDDDES